MTRPRPRTKMTTEERESHMAYLEHLGSQQTALRMEKKLLEIRDALSKEPTPVSSILSKRYQLAIIESISEEVIEIKILSNRSVGKVFLTLIDKARIADHRHLFMKGRVVNATPSCIAGYDLQEINALSVSLFGKTRIVPSPKIAKKPINEAEIVVLLPNEVPPREESIDADADSVAITPNFIPEKNQEIEEGSASFGIHSLNVEEQHIKEVLQSIKFIISCIGETQKNMSALNNILNRHKLPDQKKLQKLIDYSLSCLQEKNKSCSCWSQFFSKPPIKDECAFELLRTIAALTCRIMNEETKVEFQKKLNQIAIRSGAKLPNPVETSVTLTSYSPSFSTSY